MLFSSIQPILSEPVLEGAGESQSRSHVLALTGVTFTISPLEVTVGEMVTFSASASSDIASTINFTIRYDNLLADDSRNPESPVSYHVTGNPGNVLTTYAYDHEGNLTSETSPYPYFEVELTVFDGYASKVEKRIVYVFSNTAPIFTRGPSSGYDADPGVEKRFSFKLKDYDNDPLTVVWDFGDGSPEAVNETAPAGTEVYVNQSHTWNPVIEPGSGDYWIVLYMNLTVDDGQGNYLNTSSEIRMYVPYNLAPEGNFTASATKVDPTDVVWFYANASDGEGEALTWTFEFMNETEVYYVEVHHTDAVEPFETVYVNITHVFSVEGEYMVTAYVSDAALPENQVDLHNQTLPTIQINSKVNHLPYVMATIIVSPTTLKINATVPNATATFSVDVADQDGDVLTAKWAFGDGSEPALNVTPGGKQIHTIMQSHTYFDAGYFNVTLEVTDGRFNHTVYRWKIITITSDNKAPTVVDFQIIHSNSSYTLPGYEVRFRMVLHDAERDPIEVVWNFGDGSPRVYVNLTEFDEYGNVTCEVPHVYETNGDFRVYANFTDHQFDTSYHLASWPALMKVRSPTATVVEPWDIWDYVGLGIVFGMVLGFVGWGLEVNRKRRMLDRKGMTWEEYKIIKDEVKVDVLNEKGGGPGQGG